MTLEVLCTTMHGDDFSLVEKMNIASDAVFANQTDRTAYETLETDGHLIRMVSTETRGVGINRNTALMHAKGDILLFADDDIRYRDGYRDAVLSAFESIPDADMIVFGMNLSKGGEVTRLGPGKAGILPIWRLMRYGAVHIAVRKSSLDKANIWFSTLFGGGAEYSHGEDSLFLREAHKKGLHIYGHPYCLGECKNDESTWFCGYDKEYFFDQGALYRALFGRSAGIMGLQYCIRKYRLYSSSVSVRTALAEMKRGRREFDRRGRT